VLILSNKIITEDSLSPSPKIEFFVIFLHLFIKDNAHGVKKLEVISGRIDDPEIVSHLSEEVLSSLKDDLELLEEAGDPFDKDKVSKGELTPLFFGSAMTNFGVQTFFVKYLIPNKKIAKNEF